ncbi:putative MarR family transcriptional regulator (plasmid) [Tistrella mobilis KA081020-065]|uniref:MarR family transcriptional regulator n=2 Tax=Tistrella mobilis TaxID=171437 RepID=I3TT19_TISMK|nr:putative MarR family transcriptional regulator [Tistrella mobilis KA081020-065]
MKRKQAKPQSTPEPVAPPPPGLTGPSDFRIGFYVHDVSRMRRTVFDAEMKPLGLTRSQWWVLAQLSRSLSHGQDGMLQTDLARILDVGKVTVGGLVDRLEISGFVKRLPDGRDRRAKRVIITERGYGILETMTSVGRQLNTRILKDISPEDIAVAEAVLAQMKENLRELIDSEGGGPADGPD